jgi:hypothetical protein
MRTALFLLCTIAVLAPGCSGRKPIVQDIIPESCPPVLKQVTRYFPQSVERDLDILLVFSTSAPATEQAALAGQLPRLIEGLRTPGLGGIGCSYNNPGACFIPDVHIGVITADLGVGDYDVPGCTPGGDGAKLASKPRLPGCTPPSDPFISYVDEQTNIPAGAGDPVERVKEALSCIAPLGAQGCRFQQPLEAARRALEAPPPGFLREGAFLAIVIVTSEDDCSAARPELFDPSSQTLADPLGPLTSYRCFERGVSCDRNDRAPGPRKECKPAGDHLRPVEEYAAAFKKLKKSGRLMVYSLAGPLEPIEVTLEGGVLALRPTCTGEGRSARPALRLAALAEGLAWQGRYNESSNWWPGGSAVDLCSADLAPLMSLGDAIIAHVDQSSCLPAPPLTERCGVVCAAGDQLGRDAHGQAVTCSASCLDRVDCSVVEITNMDRDDQTTAVLPRCPKEKFDQPSDPDCGSACPCWRLVELRECRPLDHGSPYAFEILRRNGRPPRSAVAVLHCSVSDSPWGSAAFLAREQCL